MRENRSAGRLLEGALLIVSLVLFVGVHFVFHACGPKEDGSFMHCHQAELLVFAEAGVSTVLSLVLLLNRSLLVRQLAAAGIALMALLAILTPGRLIPLCMMPDMRCRAVMQPSAMILGGVLLVLAGIRIRFLLREKRGSQV